MGGSKKINLQSRYEAIIKKSFKAILDIFLFKELYRYKELPQIADRSFEDFIKADRDANLIREFEKAWYWENINGFTAKEYDKKVEEWSNKYKQSLRELHTKDFKQRFPFDEFKSFYERDTNKKCHYCDITESEIADMKKEGLIRAKTHRGTYMEIDRVSPNEEYCKDNIVFACYWCNNAKSDEYSLNEFKKIGEVIKEVWKDRKESKIIKLSKLTDLNSA